ncbi:MAG: trimethylamine methyltransferase family protein [Planctomycetota bacterium]
MKVAASTRVLKESEIAAIHDTMCRILADVGVRVEHDGFLDRLAAAGATVDRSAQTVRFSRSFVERFIAESDKFDWGKVVPSVSAAAGVYAG